MNHEKILQAIQKSSLNQPGKSFDSYSVQETLKEQLGHEPEPYAISTALPVLIALGKLIKVGSNGSFYGCANSIVRLTQPHENCRERELRRLAAAITGSAPQQTQLF